MEIKSIVSPNNAAFKTFLKLTKSKGIKKHGMALFWGAKQIREVTSEFRDRCEGVIFQEGHRPPPTFTVDRIPVYSLAASLFQQIDLFDTGSPILLVKAPPFPRWDGCSWPRGCTLCIPFQDPANVGAVIRSAAAFGVSRLLLLQEAAHPFLPKSVRVAGSTLFRIPIWKGPSIHELTIQGIPMITLSPEGRDVEEYRFPETFCLIPGVEGPGLPSGLRMVACLAIPMARGVDSLNAAMATGIVLYRWRCRLRGNPLP